MYEETTEGFKWVFNTFLECMKNKHPRTIFTDQCPAIAAGIRSVMQVLDQCPATFLHILQSGTPSSISFGLRPNF
ncbi:hypothetical protein LINPERHAP2_LOCUS96 [Linum perenne]